LSLEEKAEVLREKLKREPSREEWAQAAGMTAGELDKGLVRGRNAKQRMISCNMGLVIAIARKYSTWGLSSGGDPYQGLLGPHQGHREV